MKSLLFLISFSICCFILISCSKRNDCQDSVNCPALKEEYAKIAAITSDGIHFINSKGQRIDFTANSIGEPKSTTIDCYYDDSIDECICPTCYPASGYNSTTLDKSRVLTNGLSSEMFDNLSFTVVDRTNQYHKEIITVDFHLFNFQKWSVQMIPIDRTLVDELHDTITLGKVTYKNVVVCVADTTKTDLQYPLVWKVYLNSEFGMIGFYDLKTNSQYYLE